MQQQLQRVQTMGCDGHRFSRLYGLVPSPYMADLNGIGTVQEYSLFLTYMKVLVQNFGLAIDPNNGLFDVGVVVQYRAGTVWDSSSNIPLVGFVIETDDIKTAATAAILADTVAVANSLTAADIIWPTNSVQSGSRSSAPLTLSVQTSTGAVGTQVSTTQDALVVVDLSTVTTASIAGNAAIDVVLEVAPTNSATAGDWVVWGRSGNAQALSLAITLQSVQTAKGTTVAYVPKGYYVKVRSTGASGTTSSAVAEARAVLL